MIISVKFLIILLIDINIVMVGGKFKEFKKWIVLFKLINFKVLCIKNDVVNIYLIKSIFNFIMLFLIFIFLKYSLNYICKYVESKDFL